MHVLARHYRLGGYTDGRSVLGDRLGFGDGPSGQLVARLNAGGNGYGGAIEPDRLAFRNMPADQAAAA